MSPTQAELANGCFVIQSPARDRFVGIDGDGYSATAARREAASLYLKPTDLRTYMLYDDHRRLLSVDGDQVRRRGCAGTGGGVGSPASRPRGARSAFARRSTAAASASAPTAAWRCPRGPRPFTFQPGSGCERYPEAGAVRLRPSAGRRPPRWDAVRVRRHARPPDGGAPRRWAGRPRRRLRPLRDHRGTQRRCRDHGPDGSLDVTGNLLRTGLPVGTHDTNGWPTFAGWPVTDTYTHQQVYYGWLKRTWMAGERLVVAQTVEDEALCELQPLRSHSCDEMDSVELQIERLRGLERYVDAQSGGPGRGWLRIVESPRQARRVIAQGKLAVLIGVEASSALGCSELLGVPQCDEADIDRGLDRLQDLGVSSIFIAHWVDNAFAGAALQSGATGTFIGALELAQTGHPFATGPCTDRRRGRRAVQREGIDGPRGVPRRGADRSRAPDRGRSPEPAGAGERDRDRAGAPLSGRFEPHGKRRRVDGRPAPRAARHRRDVGGAPRPRARPRRAHPRAAALALARPLFRRRARHRHRRLQRTARAAAGCRRGPAPLPLPPACSATSSSASSGPARAPTT